MPPRESQSTFPDQFLNLDFEASVGPLVHHHQQQQQPQPQQQPQQQPPPPQPPHPPQEPVENNVDSDAPSAPQPGRPWNVRVRSRHVDPLSIDPTTNPPVRSVSTASHDSDSMLSLGGPLPLSPNAPASLLTSVLDNDSTTDSDDDDDDDDVDIIRRLASQTSESHALPDLDTTHTSTDDSNGSSSDNQEVVLDSVVLNTNDNNHQTTNHVAFSPVRLFRGSSNIVTDEDASSTSSNQSLSSPIIAEGDSLGSASSPQTPNLQWNLAFESPSDSPTGGSAASNASSNQTLSLSFGPNTSVADLKYFAERGCIVPLLNALSSPRLKTLGTRMLADYAKMPHRRVAVASNQKILEFCVETMLDTDEGPEWPAREYAVETIRSLTATEEGDSYLMNCPSLLQTLALVARGEPFLSIPRSLSEPIVKGLPPSPEGNVRRFRRTSSSPSCGASSTNNLLSETQTGLASGKARLHACIAIMNLSCGKSNKIEIASIPKILEAMRDVMLGTHPFLPSSVSSTPTSNIADEARLKAATCIKNLSNADANDGALLSTSGLVEALGYTAFLSCSSTKGATTCTTNACLALMNLSINKANKHKVFRTRGVMDSLITVISRTSKFAQAEQHRAGKSLNCEARIKACSALSNLAIGYDNKIPMFQYPGFVGAILNVINTDNGEARTKACSILWSFAAEMKNQVPVSTLHTRLKSRKKKIVSNLN